MPLEVTCGKCSKRLRVPRRGVKVACPHCGVHLSIPALDVEPSATQAANGDAPENTQPSNATGAAPVDGPRTMSTDQSSANSFDELNMSEAAAIGTAPDFSSLGSANHDADAADGDFHFETDDSAADFNLPVQSESDPPSFSERDDSVDDDVPERDKSADRGRSETQPAVVVAAKNGRHTDEPPQPSVATTDSVGTKGRVSRLAFILLASYASAVTLGLIYLLLTRQSSRLESLPDIQPTDLSQITDIPPSIDLPPGHQLHLGEQQRYGNLLVRPVRVTRGPLAFTYFQPDTKHSKPKSAPVLKLWLEFENVSPNQKFAPLDVVHFAHRMVLEDGFGDVVANSFLCRSEQRSDRSEIVLNYDHPPRSDWNIDGMHAGELLTPGQTMQVFIPSAEGDFDRITTGTGELLWRIQFRKGLGSHEGHGVTTLVDVVFDAGEIESEA